MANPILSNGQASPQSIYDEFSVAATNQTRAEGKHPVGTRGYLDDGRVFYYCSNGTVALTAGSLLIGSALSRSGNHDKIVLTDSGAAVTAGVRSFELNATDLDTSDIIENEYKDGYLNIENSTGEGNYYKIKAHDQLDASATSGSATFEILDPVKVAWAATSELTLCRNRHDRVIASSTNEEELVVGVAPIAVTASTALATDVTTASAATTTYFFWAQTWGPAAVEVDDTTVALGVSGTSGTTAKQLLAYPATNGSMNVWAVGLVPAAAGAGDFVLVDLRICP